jgi:drug/metabolite transporter (DMT)-like permease
VDLIVARFVLRHSGSRQFTEIGLLLCMIGAVVLAATAVTGRRMDGRVVGGVFLVLGFLLLLVAVHYGVNPYRGGGKR